MNIVKPKKTPVKEVDGNFAIFEPAKEHLVYQTIYCCPVCITEPVGGLAIGQTIHMNVPRQKLCARCGLQMDRAAIDKDEAASKQAFADRFKRNADESGGVTVFNEQGTGVLQSGRKEVEDEQI